MIYYCYSYPRRNFFFFTPPSALARLRCKGNREYYYAGFLSESGLLKIPSKRVCDIYPSKWMFSFNQLIQQPQILRNPLHWVFSIDSKTGSSMENAILLKLVNCNVICPRKKRNCIFYFLKPNRSSSRSCSKQHYQIFK